MTAANADYHLLRKQLQHRHLAVIGTDMDNKVCSYWCNAIAEGLKTFADFERSMLQSSQYEKRVLALFKTACFEVLGSNGFNARLFDEFVRACNGKFSKVPQPITQDAVEGFLRTTKVFADKYVPLIKSVGQLTLDRELSEAEVNTFLEKFRRDKAYTVDALKADLKTGGGEVIMEEEDGSAADAASRAAAAETLPAARGDADARTPTSNGGGDPKTGGAATAAAANGGDMDVKASIRAAAAAARGANGTTGAGVVGQQPLYQQHVAGNNKTLAPAAAVSGGGSGSGSGSGPRTMSMKTATEALEFKEREEHLRERAIVKDARAVLRAFAETRGRPMYVQEYLWYASPDHPHAHSDEHGWRAAFEEEKPAVLALLNAISGTYADFLGAPAPEYEAIDKYLDLIARRPGVDEAAEHVRRDLVRTPEYENAMAGRLARAYQETYVTDMSEGDVKYVFGQVREAALSLKDDRVHEYVRRFKEDMDFITGNVCDTYMSVYERVPDPTELAAHVAEYRTKLASSTDARDLNRGVECALVSGLEFHDVLKNKLKQRHFEVRQDSLTHAALYGILGEALKRLNDTPWEQRTVTTVDALVADLIRAP